MIDFIRKHHRLVFYSSWLLIGLLQAAFTELLDDEAYYWVFSRFLDWGYFDHPPMTALLIKTGYSIFQNELGVRLLLVLLSTLTIFLCEQLCERKEPFLFYAICYSLAVLQIAGFLAVPDVPLIFFTALFFFVYKKFITNSNWINPFFLGTVTALLMYSKYHAVLIIFFTLLSNLSLFRKRNTYIAGFLALLLFLPHLLWQYNNDWISFRYHLFESNVNPYKISHTLEYILGQLLIAGPVAGIIFWWATFCYQTTSIIERALKFTGVGLFVFFLLSSFRGKVEANWTSAAIVPILVLSHQYLLQHTQWRRWTYRLLPITIVLIIAMRIFLVVDILPVKPIAERFHQYHQWPKELRERTKGLPVVFNSSYQKASKYWFYSGQVSYSLSQYFLRRSNYNFWPVEDQIFDKPVYLLDPGKHIRPSGHMQTPIGDFYYAYDSSFHSFAKLLFLPEKKRYRIKQGENFVLRLKPTMPGRYAQYAKTNSTSYPVKIGVFDEQKWVKDLNLHLSLKALLQHNPIQILISPALPKGTYFLRFAVGSDMGFFTHNSDKIKIEVE